MRVKVLTASLVDASLVDAYWLSGFSRSEFVDQDLHLHLSSDHCAAVVFPGKYLDSNIGRDSPYQEVDLYAERMLLKILSHCSTLLPNNTLTVGLSQGKSITETETPQWSP